MGCGSCSTTKNGVPQGCGDKGHCTSGSCNKMNTFDWLNHLDIPDPMAYKYVEVSFKKGARKNFFINDNPNSYTTGDMVVVDDDGGYDVGRISLSGELVRAQMKKKSVGESAIVKKIVRRANHRDLEKLEEARGIEKNTLVKGRAIARTLDLDLKLGEVEYRGDKRKATFYYTANGRIEDLVDENYVALHGYLIFNPFLQQQLDTRTLPLTSQSYQDNVVALSVA